MSIIVNLFAGLLNVISVIIIIISISFSTDKFKDNFKLYVGVFTI